MLIVLFSFESGKTFSRII